MTSKSTLPPPLYTSYYKLLSFYWNVEPETTKLVTTSDTDRLYRLRIPSMGGRSHMD